jgi:hypothetical protein
LVHDDFVSLLCFLTTFQGIFTSFIVFSALNKEEIASLQRLLEAQERKEKEKNNHQLAQWRRKFARGAEPSDGHAMAQVGGAWRRTIRLLRYGAGTRRLAPTREKKNL